MENGCVKAQGSFDDILRQGIDMSAMVVDESLEDTQPDTSPMITNDHTSVLSKRRSRMDSTRSALSTTKEIINELDIDIIELSNRHRGSQFGSVSAFFSFILFIAANIKAN